MSVRFRSPAPEIYIMPPIPNKQNKDEKEVRLFGEKSIREEAYRQKIIELEKEVMQLEAIVKGHKKTEDVTPIEQHKDENATSETSVFLEEKIKKYIHELEAKASNISERLQQESKALAQQKNSASRVIKIIFGITALLAALGIFAFLKLYSSAHQEKTAVISFYERPEVIKQQLQYAGFYNKQYSIIALSVYNNAYKGTVELHSKPFTNWELKIIASDIIENFKKISGNRAIELTFMHDGDTYAKANFSPVLDETHYEFK